MPAVRHPHHELEAQPQLKVVSPEFSGNCDDRKVIEAMTNEASIGASPSPLSGSVIDPAEIMEKIPPEGIAAGDLIKQFQGRVGEKPGQLLRTEWIKLVKQYCDYDSVSKKLYRRNP